MSLFQTALLGIAGSLIAGIVVWLLSGGRWGAGFLASLVFSVLILYFVRRSRGGGLTDPGRR
jgi:membrane protein implicated in regulation of membrane protease activity